MSNKEIANIVFLSWICFLKCFVEAGLVEIAIYPPGICVKIFYQGNEFRYWIIKEGDVKLGYVFLSLFWIWVFSFSSNSYALTDWDYFCILSGYMVEDELADKDDYEIVPVFLEVGRDITDWIEGRIHLPGKIFFELEGFVNPVIGPDNNVEFGLNLGLRWQPFQWRRLRPYLKAGTGPGYTTQHTNEQATQWNFFSFAGVGLEWNIDKRKSLLFEYRYRHFSNASIKKPNKGVNHQGIVAGMKVQF